MKLEKMTTVKDFCRKHNACQRDYEWGSKYETMERVFSEGDDSGYIIWAVTREGVLTDRELRLFACFCGRQNWHLLTDRSRQAVEVAERHADGLATDDDLDAARDAAWAAERDAAWAAARAAARAAAWATARTAASAASGAAMCATVSAGWDAASATAGTMAVQDAQIKWLRENTQPDFGAGLEESKERLEMMK